MNIDPEARKFSEIYEIDQNSEEKMAKLIEEGKVVVRSDKEHLQMLQDDLRKAGYKKL
jgi:hypothetical protein